MSMAARSTNTTACLGSKVAGATALGRLSSGLVVLAVLRIPRRLIPRAVLAPLNGQSSCLMPHETARCVFSGLFLCARSA